MPYSLTDYALANSVLMRDRTKTQYLVLPLAAGVLARCVLARSLELPVEDDLSEVWPHWESSARELLARCDSTEDEQWATDADRYGRVADFAHAAWPAFLGLLVHGTLGQYVPVMLLPATGNASFIITAVFAGLLLIVGHAWGRWVQGPPPH